MVETRKLIELDPVSPTPSGHLAYQYLASRQFDLAIAQYQKSLAQYQNALAMDPSQIDEYSELGEAYLGKHMYPEAIAQMTRAAEMSRSGAQYSHYLARLGNARAQAGDITGAKKILAELPADDPSDVYAGLGERDKSIALLYESYRRHTFLLDAGHRVELDPLRSDPRFIELLQRIHLR
jgi:tetratricopeptide (TPR) repeat protein